MMKLIHLSDLHFGTHDPAVVEKLVDTIAQLAPDLVIVSGDFTQTARSREFLQARAFLDSLNTKILCVPGNHDIPGFDLLERLTRPYDRYQRYISSDLCPLYENEFALIIGMNSARRMVPHWNWANGALSGEQRRHVTQAVRGREDKWLICVFHHPIHEADHMPIDVVVFGGHEMMRCLHTNGIDLALTGHVHHASISTDGDEQHKTVYLSASTALSSRLRGQENGFNLITLNENDMRIDVHTLHQGEFVRRETYEQKRF